MTGPGARLLALIVLFSAFRYLHDLAKLAIESSFVDFGSYYTYATLIGRGLNPLDPEAVAQVDRALGIRRAGTLAPYPALFYIALQPLTLLPFPLAAGAWLAANQACLLGALGLWLRRVAAAAPVGVAAALFVVLNYQPLFEDFAVGQVNTILLFLVTLAWWAVRADRPWIAAAAVAATLNVKVHYALLLPLLWWIGHARVCWRAIALAGAGLGISLIIWGPAFHIEYARTILSMPESHQIWTLNFSRGRCSSG